MTTYPVARRVRPGSYSLLAQALAALAGGVSLFLVFLLVFWLGMNVYFAGKIYPGVSMAGISLSGLAPEQAAAQIAARLLFVQSGQIVLQDGNQTWVVHPAELGVSLDPTLNAQIAYTYGRTGSLFQRLVDRLYAWHSGVSVSPQVVYDEPRAQEFVAGVASQVDLPARMLLRCLARSAARRISRLLCRP